MSFNAYYLFVYVLCMDNSFITHCTSTWGEYCCPIDNACERSGIASLIFMIFALFHRKVRRRDRRVIKRSASWCQMVQGDQRYHRLTTRHQNEKWTISLNQLPHLTCWLHISDISPMQMLTFSVIVPVENPENHCPMFCIPRDEHNSNLMLGGHMMIDKRNSMRFAGCANK